jgi:hypothetical protein
LRQPFSPHISPLTRKVGLPKILSTFHRIPFTQ